MRAFDWYMGLGVYGHQEAQTNLMKVEVGFFLGERD
jgi:hypothetical protein